MSSGAMRSKPLPSAMSSNPLPRGSIGRALSVDKKVEEALLNLQADEALRRARARAEYSTVGPAAGQMLPRDSISCETMRHEVNRLKESVDKVVEVAQRSLRRALARTQDAAMAECMADVAKEMVAAGRDKQRKRSRSHGRRRRERNGGSGR